MPQGPTAGQPKSLAEEIRGLAARMHDPWAKRTMLNMALSYERLAKHVRMREESQGQTPDSPA